MRRFFAAFSQTLLSIFFIICILGGMAIFFGIGIASGFLLACWEDVESLRLDEKLEYEADRKTWREHLEIYSAVCEVQEQDKTNFLIDKLKRLTYEQIPQVRDSKGTSGQYSVKLNEKQTGTIDIVLRKFQYPHLAAEETKAKLVTLSVKNGKIQTIQDKDKNNLNRFYLEPELIAEKSGDDLGTTRKIMPLVDIPDKLINAFIAIEDQRFYQHWGIDIKRLGGAIRDTLVRGDRISGTSTFTQQLTRNVYLGRQRDLVRKVREILLTLRIEKVFSKDEILERYLNYIDLGRAGGKTLHGVHQAAMGYFGKEVDELEYHECAMLAALPKAPSAYSPIRELTRPKAISRRNLVLAAMFNRGYLTPKEYRESRDAPLKTKDLSETSLKVNQEAAGHFIQYINEQLERIPELENRLYSEGLKVYTTIDMSMQSVAVKAVADHLRHLDRAYSRLPDYDRNKENPHGIDPIKEYMQAALVAFEPRTGHIKAMVGGRDYRITEKDIKGRQINFLNRTVGTAQQPTLRQPGSAFKPIVFAALMQEPAIVTPSTILVDEPWGIVPAPRQPKWFPKNYSPRFRGGITVREVITHSINVPTVRATLETPVNADGLWEGIERIVTLTKSMGIQTRLQPTPALTLGASGMKVLELTAAYGVFANRGIRTEPVNIQYVTDAEGTRIYPPEDYQPDRTRVLDEKVAYQITSFLESVIQNGTGRRALRDPFFLTRPAAGKTGTTNNNVDAWFVGYTTDLVVGVWVGFDEYRPNRHNYNKTGAESALPIWARFIVDASRGPEREFQPPEGIVVREIDKTTGYLRKPDGCPPENVTRETFIKGQEPQQLCNQH